MLGLRTQTTMAGPKACSQPVDLPRKLIGHSGSQVVEEGLRKKCSVFRRWTKRRSLVRDEKQPWHGLEAAMAWARRSHGMGESSHVG